MGEINLGWVANGGGLGRGLVRVLVRAGSGYGDGDGYGDWDQSYWLSTIPKHVMQPGALLAYWRSNKAGGPANGGSDFVATPGLIQEINGPLELCTERALHATLNPLEWRGERLWLVALYGELVGDCEKVGALKREILCEVNADWL